MAENYVIGAGRLYVATLDANDIPGPERFLGDSPGASVTGGEGERLQVFAGDGADSSRKLIDKLLDVSRSMSLTLRDISLDNLALFLMGDKEPSGALAAVGTAVPERFPASVAGDEFQIGTYGSGVPESGYTSLQKQDIGYKAGDSGAAVVNTTDVLVEPVMADWIDLKTAEPTRRTAAATSGDVSDGAKPAAPKVVVFLDTGRVRVLLDQAQGFGLSYTPVGSFDYVESATDPVEGAVRYVEYDPRNGVGRSVYMTKATIRPNGEWALKSRTNEQTLGLTCEALGKVYIA
ncbi:MAG: hypothetical protein F4057_01115 [Acidobacteria bacterium]|nr:hypothetical protein [Acidobacteriota bacterium]MYI73970.1 hypothetical protein [Acidobacteriota bacterium]